MDKAFIQEVVILLVTLFLSYLETCLECSPLDYFYCNDTSLVKE